MARIYDWKTDPALNQDPSPDGFPELMPRSGVNDSAREVMASVKTFYDEPMFRRPFEAFSLTRSSGTVWLLTDSGSATNAAALMRVGQRVRMTGQGVDSGKVWVGWVSSSPSPLSYSAPVTTFSAEWIDALSADTSGPTGASSPNLPILEVAFRDLGRSAWFEVGAAAGQIPLIDDLQPHVLKAESELDVGKLQGSTLSDIQQSPTRGRININGAFNLWQRGETFGAAAGFPTTDASVLADCWTMLNGGVAVTASRSSDAPPIPGVSSSLLLKADAASGTKFGVATFIELEDVFDVTDEDSTQTVSLSFWTKQGAVIGINDIRAYVVNVLPREPTVTPVQDYAAGVAGVNVSFNSAEYRLPTKGSVSPVQSVALTQDWQEVKIEGLNVSQTSGSGGLMVAFIIDTAALGGLEEWLISAVQLNQGEIALPFASLPLSAELARAQRYYESVFDWEGSVFPSIGQGASQAIAARSSSGGDLLANWQFRASKFKVPTIVNYDPLTASPTGEWGDGSTSIASASSAGPSGATIEGTGATANTVYRIAPSAHANIWGNN